MRAVTKQVRLCPRGFILSDTKPFTPHLAQQIEAHADAASAPQAHTAPRAVTPGGRIEVHYQAPAEASITLETSTNGWHWVPAEQYRAGTGCIREELVHEAAPDDRFVRWVVRLTKWSGMVEISSRDIV